MSKKYRIAIYLILSILLIFLFNFSKNEINNKIDINLLNAKNTISGAKPKDFLYKITKLLNLKADENWRFDYNDKFLVLQKDYNNKVISAKSNIIIKLNNNLIINNINIKYKKCLLCKNELIEINKINIKDDGIKLSLENYIDSNELIGVTQINFFIENRIIDEFKKLPELFFQFSGSNKALPFFIGADYLKSNYIEFFILVFFIFIIILYLEFIARLDKLFFLSNVLLIILLVSSFFNNLLKYKLDPSAFFYIGTIIFIIFLYRLYKLTKGMKINLYSFRYYRLITFLSALFWIFSGLLLSELNENLSRLFSIIAIVLFFVSIHLFIKISKKDNIC
jgi:hypothetical protein